MASKEMYALGSQASVIRDLFVFFPLSSVRKMSSISASAIRPSRPRPVSKKPLKTSWKRGNPWPSTAIRQLPVMRLSARAWPIT